LFAKRIGPTPSLRRDLLSSKSVDYSDLDAAAVLNGAASKAAPASMSAAASDAGGARGRRHRSRSIEDVARGT